MLQDPSAEMQHFMLSLDQGSQNIEALFGNLVEIAV